MEGTYRMNRKEQIGKGKDRIKQSIAFLENTFGEQKRVYIGFVLIVSVMCILAAEVLQVNGFRNWYYNLIQREKIEKSIQYKEMAEGKTGDYGSFVTYYRFEKFGATNPKQVDTTAPMVALTFDDGPNPEYTGRILQVLEENYSHASFFVVGSNAEKYPELLQDIIASGNEIGNHTFSHANLTEIDSAEVESEIDRVNRVVKRATGEIATVIRPPYGAYNEAVLNRLEQPVVLWDLDTEDWDSRNAQMIVDNIVANVEDGDIILMHDIYSSTAEAVELLIPKLKEMGYQVVSVSEMARYKGKELELHKAYGEIKNAQ